jgi:hypothetical protein
VRPVEKSEDAEDDLDATPTRPLGVLEAAGGLPDNSRDAGPSRAGLTGPATA